MVNVTDESNKYSIDSLTPALRYVAQKGRTINRLGQYFCFKDFPELSHVSFRRRVGRLRKLGWIVPSIKSNPTFYKIKGEYVSAERRTVTHEGMMVGTNMQDIINEASKQIPTIHDIKIKFSSRQLYNNAINQGMTSNKKNKGIFLDTLTLSRYIYAKIALYPETVIIDIGCTWEPIIYDIRGAQEFIGYVEVIRASLHTQFCANDMPDSLDWIVTHYHLNQDGQTEFSDVSFHRTISHLTDGFIRMYAKRFPDNSHRMRLERPITPDCTVRAQITDMKNIGNYLYSNEDDLSKIMPSQILGYNKLSTVIEKQASLYNPTYFGASFI